MKDSIQVEIVRDLATLRTLEPDWRRLQSQGDASHVFMSWEWVQAWWETICPQPDLYVLAARDEDGTVRGIAPFHRHRMKLLGALPFGCLRVLGADRLSGAEYPDLLVNPEAEPRVIEAFAAHLRERTRDWDCLWLPHVASWNGASQRWTRLAAAGGFRGRARAENFSAIPLPADFATYEQSLSKNARHHLRRCRKKLLSTPDAGLEVCDDPAKLETMLAAHIRMNQQRWQSAGLGGTFRFPARVAFYEHLARATLASGRLAFFGLRAAGSLRATWFGFLSGQTYHSLSLGYDVEFEKQNHTGAANVLFGEMLPVLMARGVREFDHLGGLSEYKARWGALPRVGSALLLCARSFRGLLAYGCCVWPGGRFLRLETPGDALASDGPETASPED